MKNESYHYNLDTFTILFLNNNFGLLVIEDLIKEFNSNLDVDVRLILNNSILYDLEFRWDLNCN
jgi:hypothetical protein